MTLTAVPRSGRGPIMAAPLFHGRRALGLLVVEGTLLFVTDGLVDAVGLQRLCNEAAAAPPYAKRLAEALLATAKAGRESALTDDVTVVAAQSTIS